MKVREGEMNELKELEECECANPSQESARRNQEIWAHNVGTLWAEVEMLTKGTVANRLALGKRSRELRSLYSDRNLGKHRLTSGHGCFEEEIRRRGYKPRTVRQWIQDYEASLAGRPLSSDKQRARRMN